MGTDDLPTRLDIRAVGILGGPGSGKGTQCSRLEQKYDLRHISIGGVMRAEMNRNGCPYAKIIRENMLAGRVGPQEVTIGVVKRHIEEAMREGVRTFVLDGFPRSLEGCKYFEQQVAPIRQLVVLDCPEEVLVQRLARRGRFDDATAENISKRMKTFQEVTGEMLEDFVSNQRLARIKADQDLEVVSTLLEETLTEFLEDWKTLA